MPDGTHPRAVTTGEVASEAEAVLRATSEATDMGERHDDIRVAARTMVDAPDRPGPPSGDPWGFRTKRREFLHRFGFPGTPAGDRMQAALDDLTDALLREARYHATWPVTTAEKWRYDRMLWVFDVMLGDVPADTPAPPAVDFLLGADRPVGGSDVPS